jgi:hypothetical protein
MSTRMSEEDWSHTLEVFRACLPRRGRKGCGRRRKFGRTRKPHRQSPMVTKDRPLPVGPLHFFLVPRDDWFVRFNERPISLAFDVTEPTLRPSFRPITRVGVFAPASDFSSLTSSAVQSLRGVFSRIAMLILPCRSQCHTEAPSIKARLGTRGLFHGDRPSSSSISLTAMRQWRS